MSYGAVPPGDWLRVAPDDVPVGLALTDAAGRFVVSNPALCEVLARSEEELRALAYEGLLHPEDRAAEHAHHQALLAGDVQRYTLEARLVRPSGEIRHVSMRASLSPPAADSSHAGPDGHEVSLVLRRVIDLTEIRRAEAERDRLFNLSPDLIAVTGLDGRLRRVNPAFSRLFGWSEEELLGRTLAELAHPDDRRGVLAGVAKLAGGEPIIDSEVRGRCRDGSYRWLRYSGMPVADEGAIYVWIRDVSRRKSAEEQFQRVFEDSPVGIVMVDGERRILRANAALCQLLGYAEGELVGRRFAEVFHPDDVDLDSELARRLVAGEIPGYAIEQRYLRKDGDLVWGRLQTSIAHGEDGQLLYRLDMVEDITEEKEADAARRENESLKDAFIRVVAHDLQNPLVAIAGLAGLLAEGPADLAAGERRRILGRIAIHAERLKDTVASFLDLDRLRQGAVTVRRCPTDLAQLAQRVAENVDRGDHPLSVEASPVVATVDPEMTEHILTNLLQNAVTHTAAGTPVWIRVGWEPAGVTVAVDDAGPGIPEELKLAGFELFRTSDPNARRTGVGLWVVARLAELHGGQAWVEDRPGGGAAFRVLLSTGAPEGEVTTS